MEPECEHKKSIHLHQGEIRISTQPEKVTTILGSCIAICLHHREPLFSAVCHAVYPEHHPHKSPEQKNIDYQYVDQALYRMIQQIEKKGINPRHVTVKLFGGASSFSKPQASGLRSVGQQNIDKAREMLEYFRMPIDAEDTGGTSGRKLVFCTGTGKAYIRKLEKHTLTATLNDEESL